MTTFVRTAALRPLDLSVGVMAAAGAAIAAWSAVLLPRTPHVLEWMVFGGLALIAGRFPLRIPGITATFAVTDTFFVTSALLFGPAPATVIVALDSLLMSAGRGYPLQRFLFNGSAPAISFWAGCQVFFGLLGSGPVFDTPVPAERIVLPLAAWATVYYLLNSGLTAVAVALEKNVSPLAVWRRFGMVFLNYYAAASAAFFLYVVVTYVSLVALAAVVPLFAIFHLAMRSWTGRLRDAEQHVATIDRLYLSTIGALSTAIEAKDGVTSNHIHRVQHYAMGLAKAIGGLDEQTMKAIEAAALLHDTGKLAVPERILNKPGKLTAAEFETMKLHVDVGADILSSIDFPYPVVPIVRAHHENWDGTGYPNGLKGFDIPIGARILSVVDCYDALTSDRPYRGAMSDDRALAIIRERRGTMYDPVIVDMFERVCRDIGPLTATPQLQKAIQQITKAAAPAPVAVAAPAPANPVAEGDEALHALGNLARVVSGKPSRADLASLIWVHVHHLVPTASCAFFLNEVANDSVRVAFAAGPAASLLQGLDMKIGDRLTGWVAENQQAIVNSEAALDLGPEAALFGVKYCLALPLMADGQLTGVLSLYAAEPFRDEQTQTLQFVMPHLGQMFVSLSHRTEESPVTTSSRSALRVVARR
jgi:putative nucleotidyltransferase with HDIG domain